MDPQVPRDAGYMEIDPGSPEDIPAVEQVGAVRRAAPESCNPSSAFFWEATVVVTALRLGGRWRTTGPATKGLSMGMERKPAKGGTYGPMDRCTLDNGRRTDFTALARWHMLTVGSTRATGSMTESTGTVK